MILTLTKWCEALAKLHPSIQKLIRRYYRPMIYNERALANIQKTDRVLFIGGGPLPISAMMHQDMLIHAVDVVECDVKSLEKAKHYACKSNCKLHFIHALGQDVNVKDYDVIIVAKQVFNKRCILRNIQAQAKQGTKVLFRYYKTDDELQKIAQCTKDHTCLIVV